MAKEELCQMQGVVIEALANAQFRVKLIDNNHQIICHIAGRLRKNFIRVIPGDEVSVEMSAYDLTKGRITYRGKPHKNKEKIEETEEEEELN